MTGTCHNVHVGGTGRIGANPGDIVPQCAQGVDSIPRKVLVRQKSHDSARQVKHAFGAYDLRSIRDAREDIIVGQAGVVS